MKEPTRSVDPLLALTSPTVQMFLFQAQVGDFEFATSMDYLGAKMAEALEEHPQSWFVSALASLYWRVSGDFGEAAECLRHSLYFAPADARDVGDWLGAQPSVCAGALRQPAMGLPGGS